MRYKSAIGVAVLLAGGLLLLFAYPTLDTGAAPTPLATNLASAPADISDTARASAGIPMPERLFMGDSYKDRLGRIRARQVNGRALFTDDQSLEQARQQQVLFSAKVTPTEAAASPLANERRLNDGRQWIRYDMNVLAARAEGDRFLLPLSVAHASEAEIDAVDIVQGQYRWSGRILGQSGGTFHITQAMGDKYAVGAIKTPHGEFLLEAKSDTGWVVESGKEFSLPPDGKDTVSTDGSHRGHAH